MRGLDSCMSLESRSKLCLPCAVQWVPGGEGAFMALEKFLQEGLSKFGRDRAKTDRSSTSRLSSHIHYGELSIRFIYYVVRDRLALSDTILALTQQHLCTLVWHRLLGSIRRQQQAVAA